MAETDRKLTKTCTSCGLEKPLSAFLQMTGLHGRIYSSICSACRKIQIENAKAKESSSGEGSKRDTGGANIGANERVASEIGKKMHYQQIEQQYHHERGEKEIKKSADITRQMQKAGEERTHRETKKTSFTDNANKTKYASSQSVFGGEQQTAKEKQVNLTTGPFQADQQKYGSVFRDFARRIGKKELTGDKAKADKEAVVDYVNKITGPKR